MFKLNKEDRIKDPLKVVKSESQASTTASLIASSITSYSSIVEYDDIEYPYDFLVVITEFWSEKTNRGKLKTP